MELVIYIIAGLIVSFGSLALTILCRFVEVDPVLVVLMWVVVQLIWIRQEIAKGNANRRERRSRDSQRRYL